MKRITISEKARNAIMLGVMCAIAYLAVYLARNILSAVSPQMIELGVLPTEKVGTLSSAFFITYAIGQLINGSIGDKIKTKYMICFGLALAGVCNLLFAWFVHLPLAAYAAYGMTGFFLAMIYGPMVKLVAENIDPIYVARCSLGYNFSSFFGSPLAGLLAVNLTWNTAFSVSSAVLIIMAVICFTVFHQMERHGIIRYGQYRKPKGSGGGVKVLIKHRIIKFIFISIITGVVRTTVVFWLPTYLSQHLGFASDTAALLFTVSTLIISAAAFLAIFIYERLNRNIDTTLLLSFSVAAVAFLLVYLLPHPAANIACMIVAITSSNCAASMLWNIYCPSLRDTGMVSGATGFLDFVGYMSAAISSTLFAEATTTIGWGGLILVWLALMLAGIVVSLPYHKFKKTTA
ncbi:MAG: MFS transporter [Clostridia bacterium]|nr:MFS transporter [Clostridia bacterium]